MPNRTKLAGAAVICVFGLMSLAAQTQESPDTPAAPVPSQITSAKRVFISNGGERAAFRLPKDAWYKGGPNRTYNQFYSDIKTWGHYELVASPADADLVFEIGFTDRLQAQTAVSEMKLVILEAKSRLPLWTVFEYVDYAGMAKNREKNYDATMQTLIEDVKSLASGVPAPAAK